MFVWYVMCGCVSVFWGREAEFLKSFLPLGNCRWFIQFGESTGMGFVWEEQQGAKVEVVGGQGMQGWLAWLEAEALASTEQGHQRKSDECA